MDAARALLKQRRLYRSMDRDVTLLCLQLVSKSQSELRRQETSDCGNCAERLKALDRFHGAGVTKVECHSAPKNALHSTLARERGREE